MTVKLFVEGGGDAKSLHIDCRRGFSQLLERAGFKGRMPRIKACGSRNAAYDDFLTAHSQSRTQGHPILLVDSEGPVSRDPWGHLSARDGWSRPSDADDGQAQLMVQCMESWCVADRGALRAFFGSCIVENALPAVNNLEACAKDDVQRALENATRSCGRKRAYAKGRRSFQLLGVLDPDTLREHLPQFARLCEALGRVLPV